MDPPTPYAPTVHYLQLPHTAQRSFTILILVTDTPIPSVKDKHGGYPEIFTTLFRNSLSNSKDKHGKGNYELTTESYDVVNGHYPSLERVKESDAILITGSAASAYEPIPWITNLVEYIASLQPILFSSTSSSNPTPSDPAESKEVSKERSPKLIGICFGHQIVARAFGGKCERNPRGWEVGVRNIDLTGDGRKIFEGIADSDGKLAIHQMHRDHVPSLPSKGDFVSLGSTPACALHGMVSYGSAGSEVKVLTLQGHPEFSPDIVQKVVDKREEMGVFSKEMAEKSRGFARERDQGVAIGAVILRVIGVDL